MDSPEDDIRVRVAVRIRPLLARERIDMCQICTSVTPNEPQLRMGKEKLFTFDYVFDTDTGQHTMYDDCAKSLIQGTFDGYNATIFAYGQTGSGKTFTMGTGFEVDCPQTQLGIIPRAVQHLFLEITRRKEEAVQRGEPPPDFKVNAQFMELYNEEIHDLLDASRDPSNKNKKSHIRIHEDANGGIYCVGVTSRPVHSMEETMQCLEAGALGRTTASTNMNSQSSRSHAVFTLHIRQTRLIREEALELDGKESDTTETSAEFETLTAKFHFVDLAGSERLKRTGATGDRAKEGISINCGLLALGNVISALGDKGKKISHVPYRDSKLTRLLQDSLGGNSRTVMIACISPADQDFVETLNTLNYANRARNIRNKVVINQDKTSKQISALKMEILALQQELLEYKVGKKVVGEDGVESVNDMFHENTMLQTENNNLRQRMKALQQTIERLKNENVKLMSIRDMFTVSGDNVASEEVQKLIQKYISEIEDLRIKLDEAEGMANSLRRSHSSRSATHNMSTTLMDDGTELLQIAKQELAAEKMLLAKVQRKNKSEMFSDGEEEPTEENGIEAPEEDEELAESLSESDEDVNSWNNVGCQGDGQRLVKHIYQNTDNLHSDLAELTCEMSIKQKLIEELETAQKRLKAMKQQYEDKLVLLQTQIRETEQERDRVLSNMGSVEHQSHEQVEKIKGEYERKLSLMQSELAKVQAAKREHAKLLRNQAHHEKQLQILQKDLNEMKKLKVKLMNQLKNETLRNKEVERQHMKEREQHKKEQRIMQVKMKKNEDAIRQKDRVLKRKCEEVDALKRREQRPMSARAAGRVGKYEPKPNRSSSTSANIGSATTTVPIRRPTRFSPRAAKLKWDTLEKNVRAIVSKRQTIAHMERDMQHWLREREGKGRKIERLERRQHQAEAAQDEEAVNRIAQQIRALKDDIHFAQDHINDCQANIVEVEESKRAFEQEPAAVFEKCMSLEEAKYLLEHFLELVLEKGFLAAQREGESKELEAKLHQENLNTTLQRDMLQFLIVNSDGMDIDDSILQDQGNDDDDDDNFDEDSSSENSGEEDAEVTSTRIMENGSVTSQLGDLAKHQGSMDSLKEGLLQSKKDKARRKTATPQELLYPLITMDNAALNTLVEHPELETNVNNSPVEPIMTSSTSSVTPSSIETLDSASSKKSVSKAKAQQSNSKTTLSDSNETFLAPPRKRNSGENVFSRLTNKTQVSPIPSRGVISPCNTRNIKTSPLTHTSTAAGHSKAVLDIFAYKEMLFSASKDRTAKMWDLVTGEEVRSLNGHPSNVTRVRYCPYTQIVLTSCAYFMKVWDIRSSPVCIKTITSAGQINEGPPVFDGLVTRQIVMPSGETVINDIAINYTGESLYSAAGNTVKIWDLRNYKVVGKLAGGHQAQIMVMALDDTDTADGNICLVTGSKDHYIKVFDLLCDSVGVITPKSTLEPPHYDGVQSLCLQGDLLFSGSRDTCIKKWDLVDRQLQHSINNAHKDWIKGLAFMPGGNCLISGCRAGLLKVWNIDNCSLLGEIKAHSSPINAIATNQNMVFTASDDRAIHLWKPCTSLDELPQS